MTIVETANNLMNGCREEIYRFSYGKFTRNRQGLRCGDTTGRKVLCLKCLAIIKAKRECWQEELECLTKIRNDEAGIPFYIKHPIEERTEELKQALKITETAQ